MSVRWKHQMPSPRGFTWRLSLIVALTFALSRGSALGAQPFDELKAGGTEPAKAESAGVAPPGTPEPARKPAEPAKADPAELARHLTELEARIHELEAKLVRLSEAPPAAGPSAVEVAAIKKEVAAIQDDAKKDEPFLNFFRKTELSGIVDGYYSYNFNHPDGDLNNLHNFDYLHNNFHLNMAKVTFEKKNDLKDPIGFRLDLGFGPTFAAIHAPDPAGGGISHIEQAYISYVAPVGSGLTVDYGLFVTPHGAEVIETKDNFNYSRSLLFTLAIPYYHMGLRAKYAINDKVALSGFLVNGWNNLRDNNGGKTVGFGVSLTPTKKLAITQCYMAGPEQPNDNTHWRHLYDALVSYAATDKLTLVGNYDYGRDELSSGLSGHWSGFAGYFKYAFNNKMSFSPRFEFYNDHDGFTTGTAQNVKEFTLTQEFKLASNMITRIEFRRDFSDHDYFSKALGRTVGNQNVALIGFSYFFSTRGE